MSIDCCLAGSRGRSLHTMIVARPNASTISWVMATCRSLPLFGQYDEVSQCLRMLSFHLTP
jgi:hypothetical protein